MMEQKGIKSELLHATTAGVNAAVYGEIKVAGAKNDKHLLKNICAKLLSNAIKFSPENGSIKITACFNPINFTLSIQYFGIGISNEDKQHLFEKFFRAKNASIYRAPA
jgi:signal transduction histidine kinase